MMARNKSVLIVGAGAFGTSTAYHLMERGYTEVTVLDKNAVPSAEAASSDISKIIRTDYNDPLYANLASEAMAAWKSEMFQDLFHASGWVLSAKRLSVPFVEGSLETNAKLGVAGVEVLSTENVREKFPVVTGELDGWNINVWNPHAAWVDSSSALLRMAKAAQGKGALFVSGQDGDVRKIRHDDQGRCIGVAARSGKHWTADRIVFACGAWMPTLLDLSGQLTAKGHSVAHIQLTPEESEKYSQIPVLDNLELGYYFPPTSEGIFKLAHSQFVVNTRTTEHGEPTTSVPHTFVGNPDDGLPLEIESAMRRNLRRVFPELAERPFCYTRLCWDADTSDRHLLITPHPEQSNLFLAGGGSAHSFKFLPVLGRYIVDLLEGVLEPGHAAAWGWRPGHEPAQRNLAHLDPEIELDGLSGWKGAKFGERVVGAKL